MAIALPCFLAEQVGVSSDRITSDANILTDLTR